jgi:hypothetical protein
MSEGNDCAAEQKKDVHADASREMKEGKEKR